MDRDTLVRYIKKGGFRTKRHVLQEFNSDDPEVIDIHLAACVQKGLIREIHFKDNSDSGHGTLYYIPYHKEG